MVCRVVESNEVELTSFSLRGITSAEVLFMAEFRRHT